MSYVLPPLPYAYDVSIVEDTEHGGHGRTRSGSDMVGHDQGQTRQT